MYPTDTNTHISYSTYIMDIKDTTYIHAVYGKAPPAQVAKGQDQHRYKLEWAAPTTCNYNHHHHRSDQDQHGCRIGVTNQGNLCKGTPFNLTQVALIATSVTPVAPVLVLVWSVVVVVACCWCSPLQLAPMLVLTFSNLHWWWFIFQPLVQILHLHACNLHCVVVVVVWWCFNICGSCVWWS